MYLLLPTMCTSLQQLKEEGVVKVHTSMEVKHAENKRSRCFTVVYTCLYVTVPRVQNFVWQSKY